MAGEVFAVARVATGALALVGSLEGTRVGDDRTGVDDRADPAALGHLPAVAGEAVPGHVGDGVHAVAERPQRLGSRPVERPHPGDRHRLVGVGAGSQREAGADRLREHQHVAGGGARLAEDAVGVHDALHGEAVDRLGVADRVTAGHGPTGLGDRAGTGLEDRHDRLAREVLGEGGDVDRHHDLAAHREHVAARVGGGDRAEVGGVVDQRREEVGRRDDRRRRD